MPTRMLPCKLTDAELLSRGREAAELLARRRQAEADKKDQMSAIKATMDGLEADITRVIKELQSGEQYREVAVDVDKDYRRKLVTTVRKDTGEIVEERGMTPAELQLELGGKRPLPSVTDPAVAAEIEAEIDAHERNRRAK